jgi:hypothetical protein
MLLLFKKTGVAFMKKCKICGKEKKFRDFWKNTQSKDGLRSNCILCLKTKNKEYNQKNKEKISDAHSKYYLKNREKVLKYASEYREKNSEKIRLSQHRYYYSRTPERIKQVLENSRRHRKTEKNKEWCRKYTRLKNEEYKARTLLGNAVRDGKILKPDRCTICDLIGKVDGHHKDYSKPLEVIWLCRKCHVAIHNSIKRRKQCKLQK